MFALARHGVTRVPSEALGLKWTDIDWANGRFVVSSPKTEHHVGKAFREIPIFWELTPYLQEAFELAHELVNVFELFIDRGETNISNVVQVTKPLDDTFTNHLLRNFPIRTILRYPFDFITNRLKLL